MMKDKEQKIIQYMGKGYSNMLDDFTNDEGKLKKFALPVLEDSRDLADFLGINISELQYLGYHRRSASIDHYGRFTKPKRNGGRRDIAAPKRKLKKVQRRILDKILYKIPISDCVHGYLKGRSVITSAESHPNQPFLLIKMDIKNFFPTITYKRVFGMFRSLGYSGHIATLLSLLCTFCKREEIKESGHTRNVAISQRILPQGAPTSPMISNIICRRMDDRLETLAKSLGIKYSRYADDIGFTLKEVKYFNLKKFLSLVERIVGEEGFELNQNKTQVLKSHQRQNLLGINLNEAENTLPREWIREYRATIYNAQKLKQKGTLPKKMIQKLRGFASWTTVVNKKKYRKMKKQIDELLA